MSDVRLSGVRKSFGSNGVIHGLDLEIDSGEFVVFVGPSGCGKSTLLRLVAGLEDLTSGSIFINGQLMNDVPPARRRVAMVFQSYALYPHMTVYKNIAFGLELAKVPKIEIEERVKKVAGILELLDLLDRYPKQLSGGQQQRVAIGRAIVRDPEVFLFDEPLSNLDAGLRVQTRLEISRLHSALKATIIYVTHDQVEAMTLADKIVVLNQGNIEQIGTPKELYSAPRNTFVAGFIGSPQMNFLSVFLEQSGQDTVVRLPGDKLFVTHNIGVRGENSLGIRPEHLYVTTINDSYLTGALEHIEHLGEYSLIYVVVDQCGTLTAKVEVEVVARLQVGNIVNLGFDKGKCHIFDQSGLSISSADTISEH